MKIEYAKVIPGLKLEGEIVDYPVVNERGVRAAAGIMLMIGLFTMFYTVDTKDLSLLNVVLPVFWLDFFLKTVFSANWSIFGFLGNLFVLGQKPEYVGAIQKRFAWLIGLVLATAMMIMVFTLNIRGLAPLSICSICLFFMWLETSCGICVGCKIYGYLIKYKVIKAPKKRPVCPGGVCSINKNSKD